MTKITQFKAEWEQDMQIMTPEFEKIPGINEPQINQGISVET